MKRVVVVGPGPLRPGLGPGASAVAAEVAEVLADAGATVIVMDPAPTSALHWPPAGQLRRRYLEAVEPRGLRSVVRVEGADAVVAEAAGVVSLAALATEVGLATDLPWLGGAPAQLLAPLAAEGPAEPDGLDVVVASDGRDVEVLAAFRVETNGAVALADASHRVVSAAEVPGVLLAAARRSLLGVRGLVTLRGNGQGLRGGTRADSTLWPAAGAHRGLRPGALLARILLGHSLPDAVARAAAPRAVSLGARAATFAFDGVAGADRTLSEKPKSTGATLRGRGDSPPVPPRTPGRPRILLVGPGAVRAGHGAEANLAVDLAAREGVALGHDVAVVTERDGLAAIHQGIRTHLGADVAAVVHREGPDVVLFGFGADLHRSGDLAGGLPPGLGTDLGAGVGPAEPGDPTAVELHVVLISDGRHPRVLGTFEHVERTEVHPEDAAAVFPSFAADAETLRIAEERAVEDGTTHGGKGVLTVRFAMAPRAHGDPSSPLRRLGVSVGITAHALSLGLVTGVDVVREALGAVLAPLGKGSPRPLPLPLPRHVAVEEHVFPFAAMDAEDTRLGERPRSSGTVLAVGETVASAYGRALLAMGAPLRRPGHGSEAGPRTVILAGSEAEAVDLADIGRNLFVLGFDVLATAPTAAWLQKVRVPHRVLDGASAPIRRGEVAAVVAASPADSALRRGALAEGVTCFTTVELMKIALRALVHEGSALGGPRALEDWAARG